MNAPESRLNPDAPRTRHGIEGITSANSGGTVKPVIDLNQYGRQYTRQHNIFETRFNNNSSFAPLNPEMGA